MTEQASTVDWVKLDGLAEWFNCSTKTMRRKLPELYASGFPHPNPVLDKWYLPRCKAWACKESSIPTPATDPLMRCQRRTKTASAGRSKIASPVIEMRPSAGSALSPAA